MSLHIDIHYIGISKDLMSKVVPGTACGQNGSCWPLYCLVLDVNVCAFMCLGSLRVKCLIKPEAI